MNIFSETTKVDNVEEEGALCPFIFLLNFAGFTKPSGQNNVFSDYLRATAVKNMFDRGAVRESLKAIRCLHRGLKS